MRNRDHEWRLVSYTIGLSSSVVLFTHRGDTKDIPPPWAAALAVAAVVLLLVAAQFHTHLRLNEFRKCQELLFGGEDHRAEVTGQLFRGWLDGIYFIAFVLLSALFVAAATYVLLAGEVR